MAVGAKRYVIDGRKIAQLNLTLASDIAKAINQEVARIRGRTEEGLRKAAEMVKERERERSRERYQKDPEAHRLYQAKWRAANRDRVRAYAREWMRRHRQQTAERAA